MKINTFIQFNVGVIEIKGVLNAKHADTLKTEFNKLKAQDIDQFVFDLHHMPMIDSTGLGAMVHCLRMALEDKGNIHLVGLQDKPRMVLEMTRTYQLFNIYDSITMGINSYRECLA